MLYSIESLKTINLSYDSEHRVTQEDVDKVNMIVTLIESTRTDNRPQPGDLLRYTDRYGKYSHSARVERSEPDNETRRHKLYICQWASAPWICCADMENKRFTLSICGDSYCNVPDGELRYIGKEQALFKDWGHFGACRNGSVLFSATVNVWEYTEPNPVFPPEYTTKQWDMKSIFFLPKEKINLSDYAIIGDGFAFRGQKDYQNWLQTYKGVEFNGNSPNRIVVFHYREIDYLISREEWDALELPLDTRMCNGTILVKVKYDDETHSIHTYRFTNDGRQIDRLRYEPYERAKGTDLAILLKKV